MSLEKYQPSPEETEKAENTMTDQQKELSEAREEGYELAESKQREKELTENIAEASSFEDLIAAVESAGGIKTSSGDIQTAEDIRIIIRAIRARDLERGGLVGITKSNGLRAAAINIFDQKKDSWKM